MLPKLNVKTWIRRVLLVWLAASLLIVFGSITATALQPEDGHPCGRWRVILGPCNHRVTFRNESSDLVDVYFQRSGDRPAFQLTPGSEVDRSVTLEGVNSFLLVWPSRSRRFVLRVKDEQFPAADWKIVVTDQMLSNAETAQGLSREHGS